MWRKMAFSVRNLSSMWDNAESISSGTSRSQSTARTSRRVASSLTRSISPYCTVRYRACSAANFASARRPRLIRLSSLTSAAICADSTSVSKAPTSTLIASSVAQVDPAIGGGQLDD